MLLQEARNFIRKWSVLKKCRERHKAEIDNLFRTCQATFRPYLYYFCKSFVTQLLYTQTTSLRIDCLLLLVN